MKSEDILVKELAGSREKQKRSKMDVRKPGGDDRRTSRHLWQGSVLLVCAAFFVLNVSVSLKELLSYSTYSSMRVTDEDHIPAPAVSICPHRPWSVPALVRAGINTSCLDFFDCVFGVLYTLEGYLNSSRPFRWQEVELKAEEVVSGVEWAREVVTDVSWSRYSLITMPCYTWNSDRDFHSVDTDVMKVAFASGGVVTNCPGMALKTCPETVKECNIDCGTRLLHYYREFGDQTFIAILHAVDEEPVPGMLQPVIKIGMTQAVTVKLEYDDTMKESTPLHPCRPAAERSHCLRLCYIQELVASSNCSVLNGSESVSCPSMTSWVDMWRMEDAALEGRTEWWRRCSHCGSSCQQRVYYTSQVERGSTGGPYLQVQMATMLHERVFASRAYTSQNFLADLGGGMGLWLGTCSFSVAIAFISGLFNFVKRWKGLKRHFCKRKKEDKAIVCSGIDKPLAVIKVSEVPECRPESSFSREVCRDSHHGELSEVSQGQNTKMLNHTKYNSRLSFIKQVWINAGSFLYKKVFSGWQDWIAVILYVGCSVAFIVHSSGTASAFFSYPTVTHISLSREEVLDPSITVCAKVPFSLQSLVQLGFNNTDKTCQQSEDRSTGEVVVMVCQIDSVFEPLIKELEGFSANLSVQHVWESASLPQHLLINRNSPHASNTWRPVVTDHNTCYKHTRDDVNPLGNILSINMTNQYENLNCTYLFPNTMCRWLLYHGQLRAVHLQVKPWSEHSLLVSHDFADRWDVVPSKKCYQYSGCLRELVVAYTVRRLISTPKAPCTSRYGYSWRNCVEKCVLQELFYERGCAPPYLPASGLKQCSVGELRNGSLQVSQLEVGRRRARCEQRCPRQCDRTFLNIRPFFAGYGTQGAVLVRRDGSPHTVIQERLVWPLSRAVCEVGGALGLYLGFSVLSVIHAVASFLGRCFICIKGILRRITKRMRSYVGRRHPLLSRPQRSLQAFTPAYSVSFDSINTQGQEVNGRQEVKYPAKLPAVDIPGSKDQDVFESKIDAHISHFSSKPSSPHLLTSPATAVGQVHRLAMDSEWGRAWCGRNVWTVASFIPCAVVFLSMALLQWREFISAPVFSSYESHYLSDVVFPGVTFCVWPPFNPKRLAELGITYNYSHHCYKEYDHINWKIKCEWEPVFEELLQRLPGAWSRPLDEVWQEAAWRPSDLFASYSFAWQDYPVLDGDADAPLQPSLTALNRCFTFTPPQPLVRPQAMLSINLTKLTRKYNVRTRCTDAKYYWRTSEMYPINSIHDFWKCYEEQFKMSILVHPPRQHPLLHDGLTFTQLTLTAQTVRTRVQVSLHEYDRLRSPRLPCVMPGEVAGGSREACVHRCLAEATARHHGCRLPYLTWSSLPFCTRKQYEVYPKYLNPAVESLNNKSSVASSCVSSCPETCRVLHYTTTDTTKAASNIEVAFSKPMHHKVRESWAYSTVQLVSNVGSLASLFLGVSLYQLLTFCLTQDE